MLFSFFLAGLWIAQIMAAPCAVFNESPIGQAKEVPKTANVTAIAFRVSRAGSSATPLKPLGRGRYQTRHNDETADCTKEISTLSARISGAEVEAEAGRGRYQTIKIEAVDSEGKSTA
ncbi:MAG: hypothetical protein GOMPHAMPRED_002170 [Gomphillus americanus]|uniref:Uncharacterized protein n=1 Tax=Gomphillus americanus TaxID=1940652 RepID=A0A8H3IMQ4_9LECA|nr:MAG: hypothetical protein GOMPHAMPRED_002170 [Gomphillus americanus]